MDKLSALVSMIAPEMCEEVESINAESTPARNTIKSAVVTQLSAELPVRNANVTKSTTSNVFDSVFGIRVDNEKISREMLDSHCCDVRKVRVSQLKRANVTGDSEWATMVVIASKSDCRRSANDNEYMFWQVTDFLQEQPIKILLFGECVKQHWKLQPGTVVLIINAVMGDTEAKGAVTLKLSKPSQVVEVGYSTDFGTCKALKVDGNRCTLTVNTSLTDYCAYHIQNAAKKAWTRRKTFGDSNPSSALSLGGTTKNLSSSSQETIAGLKTVKVDNKRKFLKPTALHAAGRVSAGVSQDKENLLVKSASQPISSNTIGAQRKLFDPRLNASTPLPLTNRTKSMKEFISSQNIKPIATTSGPDLANAAPSSSWKSSAPRSRQICEELKRKRAAEILRKSQTNPKSQRVEVTTRDDAGISKRTATDSYIKELLSKKSRFESEALEELHERQNRYFASREAEEKVESSATSLMEIKNCKVITCSKCDYTTVHQSALCKALGHSVKRHTADKRFFKCKNCQTRISCFQLLPTKPCQSCLMIDYVRVAMRDERKVDGEKLLVRGEERTFVNR